MDQTEETINTIVQRDDQLEKGRRMNKILYIPNGSGKIYITTMIIKRMGSSLNKPSGKGRKWTFYIVLSESLVDKQAKSLKNHLPWNIGTFNGNMNAYLGSQEQWKTILEKCQIMVMAASMYLNNLQNGFMDINDANLIIFDECHSAISLPPFNQIMEIFHDDGDCKKDNRPFMLGLTTNLINANVTNVTNVKSHLIKLQQTLNATIITNYKEGFNFFSAYPKESIKFYDEFILDSQLVTIIDRIKLFNSQLNTIKQFQMGAKSSDNFEFQKLYQSLESHFLDIINECSEGGPYTAFIATRYCIIEMEKHKQLYSKGLEEFQLLCLAISEMTIVRKMLYHIIQQKTAIGERWLDLFNFGSPKLKQLLEILTNIKSSDVCLILVKDQISANILYHFINEYNREKRQTNIVCDYITGAIGLRNLNHTEVFFKKLRNNDIFKKFNSRHINVLITSDVLEHDIDIKDFNYVIRYDTPNNFLTYMLSKFQACKTKSQFIILAPKYSDYDKKHSVYSTMEEGIGDILKPKQIENENNIENINTVFTTKKRTLTHRTAIPILEGYCNSLLMDRYTQSIPIFHAKYSNNLIKYQVLLPPNGDIKYPIDGFYYKDKEKAKLSAAFKACVALYNGGFLNDYFTPTFHTDRFLNSAKDWFPIALNNSEPNYKSSSDHKLKILVPIKSPTSFYRSYPQAESISYLHVISCIAKYNELTDSSNEPLEKLLKLNNDFGILSSKKLPPVASFPVFLNFGKVQVRILVNVQELKFNSANLKKLGSFHSKLFVDVLGVKDFFIRNFYNEENSYLIVPIYIKDKIYNVDWDVVNIKELVEKNVPSMVQREAGFFNKYLDKSCIVSPWYRHCLPIQRYLVTEVIHHLTPNSPFPSADALTYDKYFFEKYNISAVDLNQPLLKVKSLDVSSNNYLIPKRTNGKRNEFNEILIPEFCMWHKFPSVYWMKALMLPTILYRLHSLLNADDLIKVINSKVSIEGHDMYTTDYDEMELDGFCGFNVSVKKDIILAVSETLKYMETPYEDMISKCRSNNWAIDIDRQTNITILDILNYRLFIDRLNYDDKSNENNYTIHENNSKIKEVKAIKAIKAIKVIKNNVGHPHEKFDIEEILEYVLGELNVLKLNTGKAPVLKSLLPCQGICPKPTDILKATTMPSGRDIFNCTRMKIYGKSFLEFSVSLVQFDAYNTISVKVLVENKIKLISRRNLFYVGMNIDIGSYLKTIVFEPSEDWIPPCFKVPQKLLDTLDTLNLDSDTLHQVIFTKDEQSTGLLSDENWKTIETNLVSTKNLMDDLGNLEDTNTSTSELKATQSDIFLYKQIVTDKLVANCLESLIGTYVKNCGIDVGFKVICGLGIIPNEFIDAMQPKSDIIFDQTNSLNYSAILPGYEILENRIGYTFNYKSLLVEALTHTTYNSNYFHFKNFKNNQRLAFLGDAILDFLMTAYITQYCENNTPDEITDIRFSLVNNIIFAALSIRIGLHRCFLYTSHKLYIDIQRFFDHQNRSNHRIGPEILFLVEENECYEPKHVDVPCALADMFKSFIAAIYLDSGRNLNFVWSICWKCLGTEIKQFCNIIPKNPIRTLQATKFYPNFSGSSNIDDEMNDELEVVMQLSVISNHRQIIVHGFGVNRTKAKIAAAKIALKEIKSQALFE